MRAVLAPPGVAGCQSDALPATSSAWNSTSVSPSAEIAASAPGEAAGQVAPPSVDVRNWYPAWPAPVSVAPDADSVTRSAFCHSSYPPLMVGPDGAVRSIHAAPTSPDLGAQAEGFPARSRARKSTVV